MIPWRLPEVRRAVQRLDCIFFYRKVDARDQSFCVVIWNVEGLLALLVVHFKPLLTERGKYEDHLGMCLTMVFVLKNNKYNCLLAYL